MELFLKIVSVIEFIFGVIKIGFYKNKYKSDIYI